MRLLIVVLLAGLMTVPGAMAACNQLIYAQPGDPISLAMTPIGSYYYAWTTVPAALPSESTHFARTFSFEAPVISAQFSDLAAVNAWFAAHPGVTPPADPSTLVGCQIFPISGSMIAQIEGVQYANCAADCTVYLCCCPIPCPGTKAVGKICEDDFVSFTTNPATGQDWQTDDQFTWTVKDEDGVALSGYNNPHVANFGVGGSTHTFYPADFVAPVNGDADAMETCFTIDLVVKSNSGTGQTLLTCTNTASICLVYDPEGTISID